MDDREVLCKTIKDMTPAAWGAFSEFLRQHGFVTVAPEVVTKEKKTRLTKTEKEMLKDFEKLGHVDKGDSNVR